MRKHDLSFQEATTVFADPLSLSDTGHSYDETRFLDLGLSHRDNCRSFPTRNEEIGSELSVLGWPAGWKERPVKQKKARPRQTVDSLREEYDFSRGMCGKHSARYTSGTNVVVLESDVASAFPTAREVNEALRALAQIISRASSGKSTDTNA